MTAKLINEKMTIVLAEIEALLATAKQGKVLREGLATAIIGRPNVGKSSLMNSLVHEAKAIVTIYLEQREIRLKSMSMSAAFLFALLIQPVFVKRKTLSSELALNGLAKRSKKPT